MLRSSHALLAVTGAALAAASVFGSSSASPAPIAQQESADDVRARLDASFPMGPSAASELGVRVGWVTDVAIDAGETLRGFEIGSDAIYAVTSNQLIVKVDRDTGKRLWRAPVIAKNDVVIDIDEDPSLDTLYVVTLSDVYHIDTDNGVLITRQDLERVPTGGVVRYGDYLIYGSQSGLVVWHHARVGSRAFANRLSGPIDVSPQLTMSDDSSDDIVIVTRTGAVTRLAAANGSRIWSRQLRAGIHATPVVDSRAVWIAGDDQYLRCIDRGSGDTIWKHFASEPLRQGPQLVGPYVLQQIPGRGLTCFDALPKDTPQGRIVWTNEDAPGELVGVRGNRVWMWDATSKRLSVLDGERGDTIRTVSLPKVVDIRATSTLLGEATLIVTTEDGTLQSVVPVGG